MSEEIISEIPQSDDGLSPEATEKPSLVPSYKSLCMKLGLMMIVIFLSRTLAAVILSLLAPNFEGMDPTLSYGIESLVSFAFLYLIPIALSVAIFKPKGMCGRVYKKPQYFSNSMTMFPAMYGISILINLLTMLIGSLFEKTDLNKSFNTVNEITPDNLYCALILLFQLVVIAPIFEEFWFRGVVMESLRPYGNGVAIFISALLFGLTHANFQQFFYATALGICLGYIAISTRSLVTTTIMHAMFNSISGILLLFMSTSSVGDYLLAAEAGETPEQDWVVTAYLIFLFAVIMLMIIGLCMLVVKLRKIKKYKVPKMQTEISPARRWGIFFSRVTVIIGLVLAADTFTFRFIPSFLYSLFAPK